MPSLNIQVGKLLFSFSSQADWINHAPTRFRQCGLHLNETICLDAKGRICISGKQFRIAEEQQTYPVDVYAIEEDQ